MINSLANYNATIPSAQEEEGKAGQPQAAKLGTVLGEPGTEMAGIKIKLQLMSVIIC